MLLRNILSNIWQSFVCFDCCILANNWLVLVPFAAGYAHTNWVHSHKGRLVGSATVAAFDVQCRSWFPKKSPDFCRRASEFIRMTDKDKWVGIELVQKKLDRYQKKCDEKRIALKSLMAEKNP